MGSRCCSVDKESVAERAERQYRERVAFYDHLAARTQAAKDLLARERLYHLVRINDRTGERIPLTAYPDTHEHICTILSKCLDISRHPDLRNVVEEVKQPLDK